MREFESFLDKLSRTPKLMMEMEHVRGFLNLLRTGIENEFIIDVDDLYEHLETDPKMIGTKINVVLLFCAVAGEMHEAVKQAQGGQVPLDFFELEKAFSLVSEAITDDERIYSQPNFQKGERETEAFIEVVRRMRDREIGPEIAKIRGQAN